MHTSILFFSSESDSEDGSHDNNAVIIALATLLATVILGLLSCMVINVLLVAKLKQLRCVIVTSINDI